MSIAEEHAQKAEELLARIDPWNGETVFLAAIAHAVLAIYYETPAL